jgi:hypothetical protein
MHTRAIPLVPFSVLILHYRLRSAWSLSFPPLRGLFGSQNFYPQRQRGVPWGGSNSLSMDLHHVIVDIIRMLLSPLSRRGRLRLRRSWLRFALLALFIMLVVDCLFIIAINTRSMRVSQSSKSASTIKKGHIFIASMHWNNEPVLRSHWNAAVLDLVRYFGVENVYISIVESGSWDDTKGALRDLDLELGNLGVERSIKLLENTHADEIGRMPEPQEEGWIWTSRGRKELRRIPYLAGIRNQVMTKLKQLADGTDGRGKRTFDKVLWVNDVIFTVCYLQFIHL